MEAGSVKFELIDEDGDELPGSWTYEWSGRDPLELSIYAVTELSGRPWKWSSRGKRRARLSPKKCRILAVRIGKLLRSELRPLTATAISRIIAAETLKPGQPGPDPRAIGEILKGSRTADWDAGPAESVPAMMRALREVLRNASENDAGVTISWGSDD